MEALAVKHATDEAQLDYGGDIKRNAARCRKCNTEIESVHRHDLVECKCGAIFVDGGRRYKRRGGSLSDIIELG